MVPEAGKTIATNIPGAEWMMVEGMGHDLPKLGGPWDLVTDGMVKFMQRIV